MEQNNVRLDKKRILLLAFPQLANIMSPRELETLVNSLDGEKLLDNVHNLEKSRIDHQTEQKMMNFVLMRGKYCGCRLVDICGKGDRSYLEWICKTDILPEHIKTSLRQFLSSWVVA